MIARFQLGFANRTLGLRLPEKNRVAGAAMRTRLQRLGILRDSGHEHFNGSLVIPVLDEAGHVTELYGRKIRDDLRPGTPSHLYLPGPHHGVWNIEALAASREIIVCEALIDALTFWCAGYRNVTSSYGVEGFTEDHLTAFKKQATSRVLIAYDRDEAGERAAVKLAARLMAEGIECYRIEFPHGLDANAYALKVTPAAQSLGVAIRKAVWLGNGEAPMHAPSPASVDAPVPPPALLTPTEKSAPSKLEEPLPASPVPPASAPEVDAQVSDAEIILTCGDRRYRVRGLARNLSYELLKVNLLAARGETFYVDTLDLYSAKQRQSYITQAAIELQLKDDVIKADLGRVLLKLEALQEQNIRKALQPQAPESVAIPEAERQAALELLQSPDLIARIAADLEACGLVGEHTNKLVAYLAATSRKLDAPLAVLVQSSSAAGKSALMDAILALTPEEDRVKYSAMTGQSLFYIGNGNLKHKILAIAEEEGASRAAYALKLLHSEGELTIASTGKDPATGNLVTQEYRVEGPTMIFTTTTAIDVDAELQNRCLVLSVDESRQQTQAIHTLQRAKRTLAGLARKAQRTELQKLHQNAQRLIRPLDVLNPYAEQLTFPDAATRTRRDHEKYLTLIDVIALMHQHQRETKTTVRAGQSIDYIEATLDDIALANALAHEVLGRSLDELPPQTRRVLGLVDAYVREQCKRQRMERTTFHFSRRQLREATDIGDTQLRLHLDRLVVLEYLIVHRGARGQRFVYELAYDGEGRDGQPFVPGLIALDALRATPVTANRAGVNAAFAGPTRGQRGPNAAGSRPPVNTETSIKTIGYEDSLLNPPQTQCSGDNSHDRSYPQAVIPLAAAAR
jgi:DNA primase